MMLCFLEKHEELFNYKGKDEKDFFNGSQRTFFSFSIVFYEAGAGVNPLRSFFASRRQPIDISSRLYCLHGQRRESMVVTTVSNGILRRIFPAVESSIKTRRQEMKRPLLFVPFLLIVVCFAQSQSLILEREIDLGFFLKPHQAHLVFAALDSGGNVFITQRGNDSFLKLDQAGKVVLRAPRRNAGEIIKFDIDSYGNAVCGFTGRQEGSRFSLPLVWYDGSAGEKLKEINLGERFSFIAHLMILRPRDLILVNGISSEDAFQNDSLHLLDFNGNRVNSFSPFGNQGSTVEAVLERNGDYFASSPQFDSTNGIVFQALPEMKLIQHFDLAGNRLGETDWAERDLFFLHAGQIWFQGAEGFRVIEKKGNRYVPTGANIKDADGTRVPWHPVAVDSLGNVFFLGGKDLQTLKIYALK